ncbi:hypothetical protein [Pseudomonas asplenii]|uniref:hypothetical protein n=1 Tax=Pseudomonas asplenii TaxID=53407 RepID=UPI0023614F8F|nr:hypothetical protein [Pseudomonas asplenii]
MRMLVTPMRRKGMALGEKERRALRPLRGDVNVRCEEDKKMGRSSNVASLRTGMPMEPDLLPQLVDATLTRMATHGFVLSGIEFIDGCAYAQSWWCRLE